MSRHIVDGLGKSKVTIENGKVTNVTEPKISYCPLFDHHRNIKEITPEAVKENMEFRIKDFGMCTKNRQLRMKDYLNFGISEIICTLFKEDIIDCAVMVCEGCGTVLIQEAELAQGVGGRVSGLVETSPIPEVIEGIGTDNVLNIETAEINQIDGIKKAIRNGYKNIAVTIALAKDIEEINRLKETYPNVNIYVFAVHTTGISKEDARELFDGSDVITACASKHIREIGDEESLKTVGQSIPIYSKTKNGKKFLELRLKHIGGEKPKKENPDLPNPLI
ncbi:MAG: DUF2099 family protein [Methanobrevibacter sp.]|uniref:methanogenesis marker 8 protein n=1 Tax=Methanobrevibacter sp. TaxID=66852 RepID=UPI0026DF22DD|nr:methanogenesis marker 8 protein [Methanobrevibacter sp.]MDO5848465.1 DUF2099 family protein [Methanobrevibacter sp.]